MKLMWILCLLICLAFPSTTYAEVLQLFGDVLLSRGIQETIAHEGVDSLWKGTSALFLQDAIRIANLEGAVGDKSLCSHDRQLCFHIDRKALSGLDKFDVISLANNHSLDLGPRGRASTAKELKRRLIVPLVGKHYSTIVTTENGSIGIVAVTDVVNSLSDKKYLVMADASEVLQKISRLKKLTGVVAVYVHWGKELDNIPTTHMRQLAKSYVDAGADIVVGHHPHVVGKTECINGRPVVYSLGNFLFDQKYEETKQGAVLQCTHSRNGALLCSLIELQSPMNSFVPNLVMNSPRYHEENRTLGLCVPSRPPVWAGVFSKDKIPRRYIIKQANSGVALSALEELEPNEDKVIWNGPPMPIEKFQAVDLNGDGVSEVMLIQNIFSTLDNEVAKRVYIYSLDSGLRALWRGSGLSRPLLDALFAEKSGTVGNKPLLIALHSTDSFLVRDKNKSGSILMSYRWNGFGFTGFKEKRFPVKVERLSLSKDKIRLVNHENIVVGEVSIKELI